MYIDIVFAVADIFQNFDLAAGEDAFTAFQTRAGRGAHSCIRNLGRHAFEPLPALPADLAKNDPVAEIRVDPAKKLVKMERVLRIFYILPRQAELHGIEFKVLFDHLLDPSCDLCTVPGIAIVVEPPLQVFEHIAPAYFYDFALCRGKAPESRFGYFHHFVEIKLLFEVFLVIQFNRDNVKIILIRFRPVNAYASPSYKAAASCVVYLQHVSSVILKSRCL